MSKTDREIIEECKDDAAKWARAFCAANPSADEGTMIGWFANAIESRPREPRLTASEAVFGFASWLTTRPVLTVMSASNNCSGIPELIEEFCKVNDLSPPRDTWSQHLVHPTV